MGNDENGQMSVKKNTPIYMVFLPITSSYANLSENASV